MPVLHITVTVTVSGTGNDPGDMKLVVETVDGYVPPTYKMCQLRNVSGTLTLTLNAAGEAYFGSQKDAVNAALAEAIAAAVANAISGAGVDAEICDDMSICDKIVSGFGAGEHDGATATVELVIEGDESCEGATYTGIKWSAAAPGPVDLDVTDLLNNADTAEFSDPSVAGSIVSALLSAGGILEWDGTDYRLYVDLGSGNFARIAMAVSPQGLEIVGRIGGVDSFGNGYYSVDVPVSDSGPSTITGMTPSSLPGCPVTVGSVITKIPGDPITIGDETPEFIPLNGSSPPDYSPGAESTYGVAGGTITIDYSGSHQVLVDPGVPHTPCRIHWTFITIYPIQANPGCYNHMELLQDALHKDAPRRHAPPCIKVLNKSLAV